MRHVDLTTSRAVNYMYHIKIWKWFGQFDVHDTIMNLLHLDVRSQLRGLRQCSSLQGPRGAADGPSQTHQGLSGA